MKPFYHILIIQVLLLIALPGFSQVTPDRNSGNLRKDEIPFNTDAFSSLELLGNAASDAFGTSVAGAGDVNGDGYEDIISGAYLNDAGGTSSGRAYIYYGGPSFNAVPDLILTGDSIATYFGYSVAGAGDVNGDGYDDVIVGAYRASAFKGKAYIFYGGANMNNVPDVTMTGTTTGDDFGFSVSSAGDFNGDGFSDVVVGSSGYNSNMGRMYIYLGGSSMNNVPDVIATGAVNYYFGYSVCSPGDMDGDGYSDVAVSENTYLTSTGRVLIYKGSASPENTIDLTLTGESVNSSFGFSIASAGDFNADGYSDLIVGAYTYNASKGRAYIYYGSGTLNNSADVILDPNGPDPVELGYRVGSAGDINGDGYSDVMATADEYLAGKGGVYIYKGGSPGNNAEDKFLEGNTDGFGASLSNSDINGDGYPEMLIGAPQSDILFTNAGKVYVFSYSMTGSDLSDLTLPGGATGDQFGYSVASAGDFNNDGYDDIIAGALYNDSTGTNSGRAYIYFGGPATDEIPDLYLNGLTTGERFGTSVSGAGDVNNDGYDDVIVGAPANSVSLSTAGRAYIFFGNNSLNNSVDLTITGPAAGDLLGTSVSSAGDVNSDGFDDVIAGAPSTSSSGKAFVYFGGSPMNNVADVSFTGTSGSLLGTSVSGAGDMNGDGYDDVIAGAPGSTNGNANVYLGGVAMDNARDYTFTGEGSGDDFGTSVCGAGDVNGDNFSDVIVGAYFNDGGGILSGRAYVYYGGSLPNEIPDVLLTGDAYDYLGTRVSAGDINGDGYSDIIAGSYDEQPVFYRGNVRMFFGGVNMDAQPDITIFGKTTEQFFGLAVSGEADMNSDGINDVVIGSYGYASSTGKVEIIYSSPAGINPVITYVRDIPFDQGGKVKIKWLRSGYDTPEMHRITHYNIYRSSPPSASGYSWEQIGTVDAAMTQQYSYTASTDNDSSGVSSGVFHFKVTARTDNVQERWESNTKPGYSVDNLAPLAPSELTGLPDMNSVNLNWTENLEEDLHHYKIFRNGSELSTSLVNNFDDVTAVPGVTYTYEVAAVDVHGNVSDLSDPVMTGIAASGQIQLTIIMQGFYDAAVDKMSSSDTMTLYLRNSVAPHAIVDSSRAMIDKDSFSGMFTFTGASSGNYYLSVKHRNTLETWSAATVAYMSGSSINYSFIPASTQAYGSNMKQVDTSPSRYGIYSGDVNKDGAVNLIDMVTVYNASAVFSSGYVVSDITGNNVVNLADLDLVYNNAAAFVGVVRP